MRQDYGHGRKAAHNRREIENDVFSRDEELVGKYNSVGYVKMGTHTHTHIEQETEEDDTQKSGFGQGGWI